MLHTMYRICVKIHFMVKCLYTLFKSHLYVIFKNPIPDLVPLCYDNFYSSGKAFHQIQEGGDKNLTIQTYRIALVRIGTGVWQGDLGCRLCCNLFQWCLVWWGSGLCAGYLSFVTPRMASHVFLDPALYTAALTFWNRIGRLSSSKGKC